MSAGVQPREVEWALWSGRIRVGKLNIVSTVSVLHFVADLPGGVLLGGAAPWFRAFLLFPDMPVCKYVGGGECDDGHCSSCESQLPPRHHHRRFRPGDHEIASTFVTPVQLVIGVQASSCFLASLLIQSGANFVLCHPPLCRLCTSCAQALHAFHQTIPSSCGNTPCSTSAFTHTFCRYIPFLPCKLISKLNAAVQLEAN